MTNIFAFSIMQETTKIFTFSIMQETLAEKVQILEKKQKIYIYWLKKSHFGHSEVICQSIIGNANRIFAFQTN